MSNLAWGLSHYSSDNRVISLPLLHVRASASITELAAQVKLTHTYGNDADVAIEATYSFPIPARAAVCSFVMIKQDGTRVVGRIQGKMEAKETYEAAISQGKKTALMVQQTPDVFQLAVGNIQPGEQVQIEVIYATTLSEDEDNDSVRFHLPVHIGARYGQVPSTELSGHSWGHLWPSDIAFLEIFVNVEGAAPIVKIECPSHKVSTEIGPDPTLPNAADLPFAHYARVSLSSESALDKDFVLTFKSAGFDSPRCVAELHPIHPSVALALTLVPRFQLRDLSRQEFIFLVDRSGSMQGQRITAAIKALVVMLRSLPVTESMFQIASFGSRYTMLWDGGSRPYNQATLDEATQHVDGMQANYGGTEIRGALQQCFETRKTDRPTTVFVLTDGEAWDVDGVLNEVKGAVGRAPAHAYLRISVLGIGNSASTAMCEGIARVGNGICMMVGEQETTFTGKIARMLKAARTPMIPDISVEWGAPLLEEEDPKLLDDEDSFVMVSQEEADAKGKGKEKTFLDIFDESVDPLHVAPEAVPPPPEVVLSPFSPIQQSPFKIQTLSPGNRLNVYAILQGKTVPKTVILTGLTAEGSEIRLSVPVTLSSLPNAPDSPPAIHALAARKIVQDLEDGQHAIASSIPDDPDLLARTVRAAIVRLGMLYSISSSQTSFVAVDESDAFSSTVAPPFMSSPQHSVLDRRAQIELKKNRLQALRHQRLARQSPDNVRVEEMALESMQLSLSPQLHSEASVDDHDTDPAAPSTQSQLISLSLALNERLHDNASPPSPSKLARLDSVLYRGSQIQSKLKLLPELKNYVARTAAPPASIDAILPGSAAARPEELTSLPASYAGSSTPVEQTWSVPESWSVDHPDTATVPRLRRMPVTSAVSKPEESFLSPVPMDNLEALARLQSFDGRFSLAVLSTLQLTVAVDQARAALSDLPDEVFATVLAMAFMCTKLGPDFEREAWEGIYDKARAFVEDALQSGGASVGMDELQIKAIELLA
ncbi:von Willebrand factor type A domain-containing protein [Mycena vulgaris]|nr:von Willebrand factor type A domain-containing protein [Mycena vulgaris]